ncbi:MAG: 2'-5' RNA ligase [Desulfuromonadaceae bacterium GWC2_58_13]|nr:MAG: 2'-5' RNA ligase [Desulfuromonadaceae bacterium GWC2_58_13]
MATVRAFLAIPLTTAITDEAGRIQRILTRELPDIRWINPASMHLTLKFFAAVSEETLEKIGQIMLSVGCLLQPFPIGISGLGTFPAPSRARVFWLGINGGPALNRLHGIFDEKFEQIGLPREDRPFTPHLTLGRRRQGISIPLTVQQHYQKIECGRFRADRVVLYQSCLTPAGAVHIPLRTVLLTGSPPGHGQP